MCRLFILTFLFGFVLCGPRPRQNLTDGQAKIVGGTESDISRTPFQVSLHYRGRHMCGGALISNTHVLTAAHCLYGKNWKLFGIRYGSNSHSHGGGVRKLAGATLHPEYNDNTSDFDIAVLELEIPIFDLSEAKLLPLATREPREGEDALVVGWGATGWGGASTQNLRSVVVQVIGRDECRRRYRGHNKITENMWCAGTPEGGKDACQGDSGGSAVVGGSLAGIISWGKGCGNQNYPGVYSNVAKLLPWITTVMSK